MTQGIVMSQSVAGGTVDFTPEGQLKWRCLELARDMIEPRPRRFNRLPQDYIITDYAQLPIYETKPVSDVDVSPLQPLFLAKQIYGWITGEVEESTEQGLREYFIEFLLENNPTWSIDRLRDHADQLVDYVMHDRSGSTDA